MIAEAAQKQATINGWLDSAISVEEAKAKGLTQFSKTFQVRNWAQREEAYDFALANAHTDVTCVLLKPNRIVLYTRTNTRTK